VCRRDDRVRAERLRSCKGHEGVFQLKCVLKILAPVAAIIPAMGPLYIEITEALHGRARKGIPTVNARSTRALQDFRRGQCRSLELAGDTLAVPGRCKEQNHLLLDGQEFQPAARYTNWLIQVGAHEGPNFRNRWHQDAARGSFTVRGRATEWRSLGRAPR